MGSADEMIRQWRRLFCALTQTAATAMLAIGIWVALVPSAAAARECLTRSGEEAVLACRNALLSEPANLNIRMALSDALMAIRQYDQAVGVLRDGFEYSPGDDRLKRKLMMAESYRDEQRWIETQERDRSATRQAPERTQVRLSVIRCARLGGEAALTACNEGLDIVPGHPELLAGRGRVWLEMDRIGPAILDFEAALAADPRNTNVAENLVLAQSRRNQKTTQCLQSNGPGALAACDAALLRGAPDELAILKRRAEVLHGLGNRKEALAAYQAAASLNPTDNDIVQALAMLSSPETRVPSRVEASDRGTEVLVSRPPAIEAMPQPQHANKEEKLAKERSALSSTASAPPPPRQFSNAPVIPGVTH
jgi:tetratricopeptide (TPR) repeat protein